MSFQFGCEIFIIFPKVENKCNIFHCSIISHQENSKNTPLQEYMEKSIKGNQLPENVSY